jgi:uncharacterized cupredoxin-like copper-binding protein
VRRHRAPVALGVVAAILLSACDAAVPATPPISPGTAAAPRELNVIAKDYTFVPSVVDLVPGETVALHFVNGGEVVHEAVFGGPEVQAAWEAAEARVADPPPGPTPVVTVPSTVSGLRVVATSGQRTDAAWAVPLAAAATAGFVVGCHIPGHFEKGMVVPVRWVGRDGRPLDPSTTPAASP